MNSLIVNILEQYVCVAMQERLTWAFSKILGVHFNGTCHQVVVVMAVVDKRGTGHNSVVMEKEGLRPLLEKWTPFFHLVS